jgi:DNA-binding NarL/FixJ family response regulator
LGITTKTVKAHRGAVMRKMGFKSLLQIPGGIGPSIGGSACNDSSADLMEQARLPRFASGRPEVRGG